MSIREIIELSIGVIALATAIVVFVARRKELAAKKLGLAGNPKRCIQHEDRMSAIETKAAAEDGFTRARLDGLSKQIELVGDDVQHLIRLHMKAGSE